MPSVDISGHKTQYQRIGKHKPVILLMHGWGNTWESWAPLIPELSRDYSLLLPDLPGFGGSDSPDKGWNTPRFVQWVTAFLQSQDVAQLHAVIGHSYGGKLAAFAFLPQHLPSPQAGLFLVSPSGIPSELSGGRRLLQRTLASVPKSLKRSKLLQNMRARLYENLRESDYIQATPFQEATLHSILSEDIRSQLTQLSPLPLHLCWGGQDTAVPPWMAYEYAALSQESDVFLLPEAGHLAHQEAPDLVLRWLRSHL